MKIEVSTTHVIKSATIDLKIELTSQSELDNLETDCQDFLRTDLIKRGDQPLGHKIIGDLLSKLREIRFGDTKS